VFGLKGEKVFAMKKLNISRTIGYVVSAVLAVLGLAVLTGIVHVQRDPLMRILFGVVLLLYAAYRFVLLRMKPRQRDSNRPAGLLILLLFVGFSGCAKQKTVEDTPISGVLQVAVSESHSGLMRVEADQFMKLYLDAKITVLAVQTREAFVHLLNDSVDCAVADRSFNVEEERVASESKAVYDSVLIAKDAVVVLVNLFNELERITPETLSSILNGRLTDWRRIPESKLDGPIQVVMTGINSGMYELLDSRFSLIPKGYVPDVSAATQNDVIQTVGKQLGAVGFVSLACFKDTSELQIEKQKVRALDFVETDSTGQKILLKLHQANVYLGKYPLHYPVYMYVHSAQSRLAVGFSGFVASTPGQQLILNRGLVPATTPIRLVQLTSGSPE
jgi:ABC-type phosphate transport system substrate-binding protein